MSGLSASSSALQSLLVRQDITAHHAANALTAGFKRSRALNQTRHGGGTDITEISRDPSQGSLEVATHAFDLGIQGEGFFKVQTANGGAGYVRAGLFGLDANRELVTPQGFRLSPPVRIPQDATGFAIGRDGRVLAFLDGHQEEVGQITLSRFPNPGGLLQAGGGVLAPFPSAGIPRDGIPGSPGFGELASGALESSNVDLGREMTDQVGNLRAFQINAKMVRTQDEMLGTLLDIRR